MKSDVGANGAMVSKGKASARDMQATCFFLVILAMFSGCAITEEEYCHRVSEKTYRWYSGNFLADNERGNFRRVPGSNVLLEAFHFSASCFPIFGGYSLFLEARPETFSPGRVLNVPSEVIDVSYYGDYHHLGHVVKDARGSITVLEVREDKILLELDLTLLLGMKIGLREWFEKAELTPQLQEPLR